MPKKRKESRFAPKLRELGFKPYTEFVSPKDMTEMDDVLERAYGFTPSKLSRAQRRRLEATKILPGFCIVKSEGSTYTYALDEYGVDWHADGAVDLEPFGFYNKVGTLLKIATERGQKLN